MRDRGEPTPHYYRRPGRWLATGVAVVALMSACGEDGIENFMEGDKPTAAEAEASQALNDQLADMAQVTADQVQQTMVTNSITPTSLAPDALYNPRGDEPDERFIVSIDGQDDTLEEVSVLRFTHDADGNFTQGFKFRLEDGDWSLSVHDRSATQFFGMDSEVAPADQQAQLTETVQTAVRPLVQQLNQTI